MQDIRWWDGGLPTRPPTRDGRCGEKKKRDDEKIMLLQVQRPHFEAIKSERKRWEGRPLVESTSVSALGNAQIPQSTSFCGLAGVTHSLGEDVVKCGVASLGLLSNVTWLIHLGSLGRPGHPCGVCGGVSSRAKSPTIVQLVRYRRVTDSLSLHAIDTQVCNC